MISQIVSGVNQNLIRILPEKAQGRLWKAAGQRIANKG
jgi:hypothetical protein